MSNGSAVELDTNEWTIDAVVMPRPKNEEEKEEEKGEGEGWKKNREKEPLFTLRVAVPC